MCKNCRQDFYEENNFSWVCKTHRSEYSAEDDLWWCCLKKGFKSPGCKLQEHQAIENDDEDEFNQKEDEKSKQIEMKNKRCLCCKQFGHRIENCPKDPNIVTLKDKDELEKDSKRLERIKDDKKKFAETQVTTTQMMKTLVKVPIVHEKYDIHGRPTHQTD